MTTTTPTTFGVVSQQDLALAAFDDATLDTILKRLNYAWQRHRPPLVAASPTVASMTRDTKLEFGCEPSADGLVYEFVHVVAILAAGTMAITIEAWNGSSWSTLVGPTSDSTSIGWFTKTHTATVPATTRRLRITYAHGTKAYWVSDVLAYPKPSSTPTSKQASGWVGYDDGLLAATGAPIHAELLNRCKASSVALLTDRKTMVLSFLQDRTDPRHDGQVTQPPGSIFTGSAFMTLGRGRLHLPGNKGPAIVSLHVHGSMTGTGTRRVIVRHVDGVVADSSQSFDLDDTWQTADLVVHGESPLVEIVVQNSDNSGTGKAMVDSIVGFWQPGARP